MMKMVQIGDFIVNDEKDCKNPFLDKYQRKLARRSLHEEKEIHENLRSSNVSSKSNFDSSLTNSIDGVLNECSKLVNSLDNCMRNLLR